MDRELTSAIDHKIELLQLSHSPFVLDHGLQDERGQGGTRHIHVLQALCEEIA